MKNRQNLISSLFVRIPYYSIRNINGRKEDRDVYAS